jgi:hypothetical protein
MARRMRLNKILGDVALGGWLYLAANCWRSENNDFMPTC